MFGPFREVIIARLDQASNELVLFSTPPWYGDHQAAARALSDFVGMVNVTATHITPLREVITELVRPSDSRRSNAVEHGPYW